MCYIIAKEIDGIIKMVHKMENIMKNESINDSELQNLIKFISSKYSQKEIDWYLSLVSFRDSENNTEIRILSNSYAN